MEASITMVRWALGGCLAAGIVLVASGRADEQRIETGRSALAGRDYGLAVRAIAALSNEGSNKAQTHLGAMSGSGKGV